MKSSIIWYVKKHEYCLQRRQNLYVLFKNQTTLLHAIQRRQASDNNQKNVTDDGPKTFHSYIRNILIGIRFWGFTCSIRFWNVIYIKLKTFHFVCLPINNLPQDLPMKAIYVDLKVPQLSICLLSFSEQKNTIIIIIWSRLFYLIVYNMYLFYSAIKITSKLLLLFV